MQSQKDNFRLAEQAPRTFDYFLLKAFRINLENVGIARIRVCETWSMVVTGTSAFGSQFPRSVQECGRSCWRPCSDGPKTADVPPERLCPQANTHDSHVHEKNQPK